MHSFRKRRTNLQTQWFCKVGGALIHWRTKGGLRVLGFRAHLARHDILPRGRVSRGTNFSQPVHKIISGIRQRDVPPDSERRLHSRVGPQLLKVDSQLPVHRQPLSPFHFSDLERSVNLLEGAHCELLVLGLEREFPLVVFALQMQKNE